MNAIRFPSRNSLFWMPLPSINLPWDRFSYSNSSCQPWPRSHAGFCDHCSASLSDCTELFATTDTHARTINETVIRSMKKIDCLSREWNPSPEDWSDTQAASSIIPPYPSPSHLTLKASGYPTLDIKQWMEPIGSKVREQAHCTIAFWHEPIPIAACILLPAHNIHRRQTMELLNSLLVVCTSQTN